MLALYLLTLGLSTGLVSVCVRTLLGEHGYVPGFGAGLAVTAGAASIYAGVQLGFAGVLQALWPSKGTRHLLAETPSHGAALVLIPYLQHVAILWPHPALAEMAGLIFLGGFLALHAGLKLITLYAVLQSTPGKRVYSVAWLGAACLCALGAKVGVNAWISDLAEAQPLAPQATNPYRVGPAYAKARVMPEGALLECPLEGGRPGDCLTFRWAKPPGTAATPPPDLIYVSVLVEGRTVQTHAREISLDNETWSTFRIPAEELPADRRTCSVAWHAKKEPAWQAVTGLRPICSSERTALLSGPFQHAPGPNEARPNIVVVLVDGLGAAHVSSMGYDRETTPSLDRLAFSGRLFAQAYTPAPEAPAAALSILTGLNPLRHEYLGGNMGPLPAGYRTLPEVLQEIGYTTAAFAEGERAREMDFGHGLERGFDVFDTAYVKDPEPGTEDTPEAETSWTATGSKATLERAQDWISENEDVAFMAFVHVSELADVRRRARYGGPFTKGEAPTDPTDIYDTAVAYLDEALGTFVKSIRNNQLGETTCIVVAGAYGPNLEQDESPRDLPDALLHVPLVLHYAPMGKGRHTKPVGLADIGPTLATMTRVVLNPGADGTDLRIGPTRPDVVSMAGNPLTFVIRDSIWRMTWLSPRKPFSEDPAPRRSQVILNDMSQRDPLRRERDVASGHADLVRRWTAYLSEYGRP